MTENYRDTAAKTAVAEHERENSSYLVELLDVLLDKLELLSSPPGWRREVSELRDRVGLGYSTVAVFGAFSAGKSSCINALLGTPLLTVSPNPTTAAVTIVEPMVSPKEGSAQVVMKTEGEVWEDVERALKELRVHAVEFDQLQDVVAGIRMAEVSVSERKALTFVKAVARGYAEVRERLGKTHDVSLGELRIYTAKEEVSCFVRQVTLPVESALGSQGVMLVDTPGVDSALARHTQTAFDYMRKADVVLFVLYYTHAFSRADKDFLLQLAGVQDVTGLDKLLVVINAVDLAQSEQERFDVRDRVTKELRQAGIARPQVIEVSSQLGLAAKRLAHQDDETYQALVRQRLKVPASQPLPSAGAVLAESGIDGLTAALLAKALGEQHRRTGDTVRYLLEDLRKRSRAKLVALEHAVTKDRIEAERLQGERLALIGTWTNEETKQNHEQMMTSLSAEWDELLFHAGERIRLRLSALYRESFHPGRFREGVKPDKAFSEAAKELASELARQMEIEARTLALRFAKSAGRELSRVVNEMTEGLADVGCHLPDALPIPDFEEALIRPMTADIDSSIIFAGYHQFTNARRFFEEGGSQKLLVALTDELVKAIRRGLEELAKPLATEASQLFFEGIDKVSHVAVLALSTDNETAGDAATEDWREFVVWLDGIVRGVSVGSL